MKRLLVSIASAVVCVTAIAPAWAATDPNRSNQWALTKIRAIEAWKASTGAGITIAVVDTGIDLDHPDLKSKIGSHYSCMGGSCAAGGDDDHGHGTHVAGIAAAATNNGVGIAGVAPAAKLMAVKVLDEEGSGDCDDIATGIRFAADHGARVINLSLGPELPGLLAVLLQGGCISDLEAAATYAWNKGVFVVIAAGNNGLRSVYDSETLEVVGATGPDDQAASYSSSGADVYAPGGDASSCSPSTCIFSTWTGGGYALNQGTSMAAPHVSGIAALLFARGYSNAQIRQRLAATADNLGGILRVNAARAVGPAASTPPKAAPKPSPKKTSSAAPIPGPPNGPATPSVLPTKLTPSSTPSPVSSETGAVLAARPDQPPGTSATRPAVIVVAALALGLVAFAMVRATRRRSLRA
ncbi:MAG TPA: S8 family serine peptidase [Actinomycetota bacterium]|nr:S8 family serine peptidase [Actinomycetota bacterium]